MRTPLTALRLRLENIEADLTEANRRDLEGALDEVERLARLVDGLLVLARVDTLTEAAVVDLRAVVAERVEAWDARAADLGVRLVAEASKGGAVRASGEGIRQVLDNLIENALEAAPAGSAVTVFASGTEIRVRDQGSGLSPEQRERAFDRFWRARSGAGSGLGLAIVRRLVEADGGAVTLRPSEAGGLEAVVSFPAAK